MGSSRKLIARAVNSIPVKKEKLRKALESLESHSSSLSNFTLDWKDFEDHFSAIEKSIDERFKALQEKEAGEEGEEEEVGGAPSTATPDTDDALATASAPAPRPELRSLCANMDAKGLRSYISDNRKDLVAISEELAPAIRWAPDPALLILDAMEGSYPYPPNYYSNTSRSKKLGNNNMEEGEIQTNRRTCINLLDKLHLISPEIKPSVRDKAMKLALDWKAKIPKTGGFAVEVLGFLQFIVSYGLVPEFPLDQVMDLFVSISRRKKAVDLIKHLRLDEKLPDLIEKLNSKGRQLDAVKFVYALNVVDKFPPIPLLNAYIAESKKMAHGVRKMGNNSVQAQNEATAREMGALKSVLKTVEEYKLETEYPCESLVKRIAQLEEKKADKKRTATVATASNSKPRQLQSNKRPRPSPSTPAPVIAANPYPPPIQTQPQLGLADHAPYMSVAGPYGLAATGSLYDPSGPFLSGTAMGHGGTLSSPRSYYPSESLVGTSSLYDRPITYNGYPLSGQPSSYGSSLCP